MEHILRNVLLALLEQPDATIADVLRMFSDRTYRREVARSLRNETVRTFLEKEFERFSAGYRSDGIAPIQNKIGAFLADPDAQSHSDRAQEGSAHPAHHG